jgi:hypothetical protein
MPFFVVELMYETWKLFIVQRFELEYELLELHGAYLYATMALFKV